MAQFQVYRLPDGPLVLDLQSDLVNTPTRVVAALVPESSGLPALKRLEPILVVAGQRYVLHTAELAAIPTALLAGAPLADLSDKDYQIRAAIDMVFLGF